MYATLKLLMYSAFILIALLFLYGVNPLLAIFVLIPQSVIAIVISYFEYKHKVAINRFPVILSSPALGAYLGTCFGFLAAVRGLVMENLESDIAWYSFASALAGFF